MGDVNTFKFRSFGVGSGRGEAFFMKLDLNKQNLAPFFLLLLSTGLTGCPKVYDPKMPLPADQPDPQGRFYSHYFELSWSGQDLNALRSFRVQSFAPVRKFEANDREILTLVLRLDVQLENHLKLAGQYLEAIRAQSEFTGNSPRVVLPPPEAPCQESQAMLQGICVRELQIYASKNIPFSIELSAPFSPPL